MSILVHLMLVFTREIHLCWSLSQASKTGNMSNQLLLVTNRTTQQLLGTSMPDQQLLVPDQQWLVMSMLFLLMLVFFTGKI